MHIFWGVGVIIQLFSIILHKTFVILILFFSFVDEYFIPPLTGNDCEILK